MYSIHTNSQSILNQYMHTCSFPPAIYPLCDCDHYIIHKLRCGVKVFASFNHQTGSGEIPSIDLPTLHSTMFSSTLKADERHIYTSSHKLAIILLPEQSTCTTSNGTYTHATCGTPWHTHTHSAYSHACYMVAVINASTCTSYFT